MNFKINEIIQNDWGYKKNMTESADTLIKQSVNKRRNYLSVQCMH